MPPDVTSTRPRAPTGHGLDGTGLDRSLVAFEEELPDFTDCDFAAREPDADWIAVAHEGGPVRGFSEMMPAFRGALTTEQLGRVMSYIRTLCTDSDWPRGELNLPRPLLTEKAYPEDEWVVESDWDVEDGDALTSAFVYEHRFGPRSQVEVVIPYGWRRGAGDGERWSHGLGDVALGLKHALFHSLDAGTIFSFGGEVILPTGDAGAGLGAPGSALEPFFSFGQILPGDAFLQGQAGVEVPLYDDADTEGFGRLVLGASFTEGDWGTRVVAHAGGAGQAGPRIRGRSEHRPRPPASGVAEHQTACPRQRRRAHPGR